MGLLPLLRSRRGQFIPMTMMVVFTSLALTTAAMNIYRVSKAKLEVQNLADATALAVASMEAKSINVVLDRNEWMNHLYPDGTPQNKHQLPGISQASGAILDNDRVAKQYAQLVATINKAQDMFAGAYNGFMGASGETQSNSGGAGALGDVLKEIQGLNDPNVRVLIFNDESGKQEADEKAEAFTKAGAHDFVDGNLNSNNILPIGIQPIEFETKDVTVKYGKSQSTLTKLLFGDNPPEGKKIGWKVPKWDMKTRGLEVHTGRGSPERQIAAGANVVKRVHLALFRDAFVRASSIAYVVQKSGVAVGQTPDQPPPHFKPTYYVRLGQ